MTSTVASVSVSWSSVFLASSAFFLSSVASCFWSLFSVSATVSTLEASPAAMVTVAFPVEKLQLVSPSVLIFCLSTWIWVLPSLRAWKFMINVSPLAPALPVQVRVPSPESVTLSPDKNFKAEVSYFKTNSSLTRVSSDTVTMHLTSTVSPTAVSGSENAMLPEAAKLTTGSCINRAPDKAKAAKTFLYFTGKILLCFFPSSLTCPLL